MGKIFSLTPTIKKTITDVMDDLLENISNGGLGKTCVLVYPPTSIPCENCIYDSIQNRSSNRPLSGGPVPFPPGTKCPLCNGKGLCESQDKEELTLKCNWESKKFIRPSQTLDWRVPYSVVETKGYLVDLPKILRADYLIANLPFAPYIAQKFRLFGEPGDPSNIVAGRYFMATWERIS